MLPAFLPANSFWGAAGTPPWVTLVAGGPGGIHSTAQKTMQRTGGNLAKCPHFNGLFPEVGELASALRAKHLARGEAVCTRLARSHPAVDLTSALGGGLSTVLSKEIV